MRKHVSKKALTVFASVDRGRMRIFNRENDIKSSLGLILKSSRHADRGVALDGMDVVKFELVEVERMPARVFMKCEEPLAKALREKFDP